MWFSVCGASFDDWTNGALMSQSHLVSVILVFLGVGPALRSRCGIE